MASRQEEKEARRKARLEQEEAERRTAGRRKRLQMAGGAVAAVVVVAAAVILIAGAGGKSTDSGKGVRQASTNGVKLPEQQISNVDDAAKAAGCKLEHPVDEGRGHEDRDFKASEYKTNPP